MQTRAILVPASGRLTFWHTYNLEANCDGALLEISTDGGATFSDLGSHITSGGYNSTITSNNSPIQGWAAWNGGTLGAMTQVVVDLSIYAGQSVIIRFRMVSDDGTGGGGWYIDDVLVQSGTAQVPGGNGVYVYSDGSLMNHYRDTNYWVDVVFPTALSASTPTTSVVRIDYTYDPLQRLTRATYSSGASFAYAYDAVGNRTAQTRTITSTQVISYVYDPANRLSSAGGVNYAWDNNGNLLDDGTAMYAYDPANRLISTTLAATTTLFNYNGDGVRLKQIVNDAVTTYTQDTEAPLPVVLRTQTGSNTA